MTRARRLGLTALLAIVSAFWTSSASAQGGPSISGYQKVSETRVSRDVTEYVYRATLNNPGPALSGASATAGSTNAATTIVDGTLTFGPIPANGSALSADTFSFRHNRQVPFAWINIAWTIDGTPANQAPTATPDPTRTSRASASPSR